MNPDFLDAHHRHWDDAERLFEASRWANADHLYGMSVECGLKRLMIAFGMPLTTSGDPKRDIDRVHADQAWIRYETYRSGHPGGAGYSLPTTNPFATWHISQRYAHQSNFDQSHTNIHRNGAAIVRGLVQKALIEGLVV
jgi:hypothetical protein